MTVGVSIKQVKFKLELTILTSSIPMYYNYTMKSKNTSLIQVRISEEDKSLAQLKLSQLGITVQDFVRISIKQFNLTGSINLQSRLTTEEEDLQLLRQSASKLNDLDWTTQDSVNYRNLKPIID